MLAYLFFHRAAPGVDVAGYEQGLRRFHEALAQGRTPGFVSSRTYRVEGMYCDWYLVENSAALDGLNDAAVTGARSTPHDAVARHAVHGTGKLMKLVTGDADPELAYEVRFSKPAGMSYPDFYGRLKPWNDRRGVSLWRRMMVLGPPPEFCLLSQSSEELPAEMEPVVVNRDPV